MANRFWDFSLNVYDASGVANECLKLQDNFGIDVNLLLFSAYMGTRGIVLTRDDLEQISAAVHGWHQQVVRPLRDVRRATKDILALRPLSSRKTVESLRDKVKALELESEKLEQDILNEWAQIGRQTQTISDVETATRSNIRLLLECSGVAQSAIQPPMLIQASLTALKDSTARP
jgi:uncharacterized protein (TIGR02444 family)